jgi:hypothetical protein
VSCRKRPSEARGNNPSDNSLAVGPEHVVQIVNSNMAIFTRKGSQFQATGEPLYGAVPTNTIFKGFGGSCEERQSGDAVVRYDQLADRWLFVLPLFSRAAVRPDQAAAGRAGQPAQVSVIGRADQPGPAATLFVPPPPVPPVAVSGGAPPSPAWGVRCLNSRSVLQPAKPPPNAKPSATTNKKGRPVTPADPRVCTSQPCVIPDWRSTRPPLLDVEHRCVASCPFFRCQKWKAGRLGF